MIFSTICKSLFVDIVRTHAHNAYSFLNSTPLFKVS